jgi:DNA-binding PadR family transcriptional regulator
MLPLNYAILKYFTTACEADAELVMDELRGEYGRFRTFRKPAVIEALMTAEANGLLEETRFEVGADGELRVFYRAPESGAAMIRKYIG